MVPDKKYQDLIEKLNALEKENAALKKSSSTPNISTLETKESLVRFKTYFNHSLDSIFVMESIYGVPNALIEVNDTFSKLIGYNKEDLLDLEPLDLFATGEKKRILNIAEQLLESKKMYFVTAFKSKDNPRIPVEVTLKTLDSSLNPQIIAIARNIEEKKLALKGNPSADELYRKIVAGTNEIIVHIKAKPRFRFQYISPASKKILGYTAQDLYDNPQNFLNNLHPEDYKKFMTALDQETATNLPRTFRFLRKDQKMIWLEIYLTSLGKGSRNGEFDAIIHDITHRQQMERLLSRKLKAENLITSISTSFIEYSSLKKTISDAVHDTGTTFNLDQIELCIGLKDSIRNQYVWKNPTLSQTGIIDKINLDATEWIKAQLMKGELVYVSASNKIPNEHSFDIIYLQERGIKSLLVSPLQIYNQTFGYLAFIQKAKFKEWDRVEIHLINTVASIVNSALRKELILEKKDKVYDVALKAGVISLENKEVPEVILMFNGKGEITGCLGNHSQYFNADQATCENKSFGAIFPKETVVLIKKHYTQLQKSKENQFFTSATHGKKNSVRFGMFFYKDSKCILCMYNV